ncbi:hypothetical protein B0H11DRAFT_1754793 [Mycena galericulata]|nr:hypothetical protein B0H11DRAFT_1754793 [Mycena galericulata]
MPPATSDTSPTSAASATYPTHQILPAPPPDLAVSNRPPCPAKAAPWFADAYTAMTRQNLGPHFDAVVAAWLRMEVASKYEQGPTNLPSKGRPKQVGSWISAARGTRGSADPKVTDPEAYAVEWQAWWDALQPAWRKKDDDGKWSVTGGYGGGKEWGALYQWGVNGTLSIVASLYFWGCAVGENADRKMAWEGAVLDVSWMLEGMAIYYEKFNRRF